MRFTPPFLFLLTVFWLSTPVANAADPADYDGREGTRFALLPVFNVSDDEGLTSGILLQRFYYGHAALQPFENLLTIQTTYATEGARKLFLRWEDIEPFSWKGARTDTSFFNQTNNKFPFYESGHEDAELIEVAVRESRFRHLLRMKKKGTSLEPVFGFSLHALEISEVGAFYSNLIAGFVIENRNSEFAATDGTYFATILRASPAQLSELESWGRLDADFRIYNELIEKKKLWLSTQVRMTASSSDTPLIEKARLGSRGTQRGVPLNRYLGNYSLSLRNDLRSILIRRKLFRLPLKLGVSGFTDIGKIATYESELFNRFVRVSGGFGVFGSYFTDDFINSGEIAFSRDGMSYYFQLGFAF